MGASLDGLDLSAIERRLFDVMLMTLTMNRHCVISTSVWPNRAARGTGPIAPRPGVPLRLVNSFSVLTVEHDLGLQISFLGIKRTTVVALGTAWLGGALRLKRNELNSAREYSRARTLLRCAIEIPLRNGRQRATTTTSSCRFR